VEPRAAYIRNPEVSIADALESTIAYEEGRLGPSATIRLFSSLVKNGMAWALQGSYGRTARDLIANGILSRTGEILRDPEYWEE
jgi:hypothetical protein